MRERMRQRWQQLEEGGLEGAERPGRPDFGAMQDELLQEVAEILNEDQLELLAEYWAPVESEGGAGAQPKADDFRLVLLAARRIRNLSREQKGEWRRIAREAMRSFRELGRTDEERKSILTAEVKNRVLRLLDDEQEQEFGQYLERMKSHQKQTRQHRRARRHETPGRARNLNPEPSAGSGDSSRKAGGN